MYVTIWAWWYSSGIMSEEKFQSWVIGWDFGTFKCISGGTSQKEVNNSFPSFAHIILHIENLFFVPLCLIWSSFDVNRNLNWMNLLIC